MMFSPFDKMVIVPKIHGQPTYGYLFPCSGMYLSFWEYINVPKCRLCIDLKWAVHYFLCETSCYLLKGE